MEPGGTLTHSQQSATCPYSEPEQSSPCPPSNFLHNHLLIIIIFPSLLGSYKLSLSHRSQPQNPVCTSPVLHMCHVPHPSHISCLYHPNDIVLAVQIVISTSYRHAHFLLTWTIFPDILLRNIFSDTFSLIASLAVRGRVSHS
jgi:hypothetical protein